MPLSSNTLFHFTDRNALEMILQENFRISYCKEEIFLHKTFLHFAVPMVSFCEIPLSQIINHVDEYGSYGLGLSREWAYRNNLNPVLYAQTFSSLSSSILTIFNKYIDDPDVHPLSASTGEKAIIDVLRYLKNYSRFEIKRDLVSNKNRYADEKEWRYVIDINEDIEYVINGTQFDKYKANNIIKDYRLKFDPNDIKYVIIEREDERAEFIDIVQQSKGMKYEDSDVEKLKSRILTVEQIRKDF